MSNTGIDHSEGMLALARAQRYLVGSCDAVAIHPARIIPCVRDFLGVSLAIAPAVGYARIVGVAPGLALGCDFREGGDGQTVRLRDETPTRSPGPVDTGPAYG